MKIKEKIKKVFKALMAMIMFLPHKICAAMTFTLSANTEPTLYGVEPIESSTYLKLFGIPIVTIIIGLIVYYKKSKHKISEKIAVTLLIVDILGFIYIFICSR